MCFGINLGDFILSEVLSWGSVIQLLESVSLCLLSYIGEFQPLLLRVFFCPSLSLSFCDSNDMQVRHFAFVPQVTETLITIFLFSVSYSNWVIISTLLSSSFLILFSQYWCQVKPLIFFFFFFFYIKDIVILVLRFPFGSSLCLLLLLFFCCCCWDFLLLFKCGPISHRSTLNMAALTSCQIILTSLSSWPWHLQIAFGFHSVWDLPGMWCF